MYNIQALKHELFDHQDLVETILKYKTYNVPELVHALDTNLIFDKLSKNNCLKDYIEEVEQWFYRLIEYQNNAFIIPNLDYIIWLNQRV